MKVTTQIVHNLKTDEIVIKCKELNSKVQELEKAINKFLTSNLNISLYQDNKEIFLPLTDILFFEAENNIVYAHSLNDTFKVKHKLYELENILNSNFVRISKSTIININHVYSVSYSIASSSLIQFYKSHKQVYASRSYYKTLKSRLKERK